MGYDGAVFCLPGCSGLDVVDLAYGYVESLYHFASDVWQGLFLAEEEACAWHAVVQRYAPHFRTPVLIYKIMFARAYGMKEDFVIHALAVGLQYHLKEVLYLLRCVYVQLGGSAQQGHGAYQARQSEDVVAMVVADEDVSYLQHAEAKPLHGCLHAFAAIYHVVLAPQFQDLRGGLVA